MAEQKAPFDIIEPSMKNMLTDAGEIQRAYTMALIYQNCYDFYAEKHEAELGLGPDLHEEANKFAMIIVSLASGVSR